MAGVTTMTTVELPEPGPGCMACRYEGLALHFYNRGPSDPPGNQLIPCPVCSPAAPPAIWCGIDGAAPGHSPEEVRDNGIPFGQCHRCATLWPLS